MALGLDRVWGWGCWHLELVHQQVRPCLLVLGQAASVALQQRRAEQEQVVEVDGIARAHRRFVAHEGGGDHRRGAAQPAVGGGGYVGVLGGGDGRLHLPRGPAACALGGAGRLLGRDHAHLGHDLAHHLDRVVSVVHCEARPVRQLRLKLCDVAPQHREAQGVEGAQGHRVGRRGAEHAREPLAQLARRLVGEGQREDAARRHLLGAHQVRDVCDEDARLARAWPRRKPHGAARREHGGQLLLVHPT